VKILRINAEVNYAPANLIPNRFGSWWSAFPNSKRNLHNAPEPPARQRQQHPSQQKEVNGTEIQELL
jgi:hypothetical protein